MTTTTTLPSAIQPAEADALLKSGTPLTFIDVRTPVEFESEHIPGSYNLPLELISEHAPELQRVERPIILVCRMGNRALQAEQLLRGAGLEHVHTLTGGTQGWIESGLAVKRGQARWSLERQVRAIAGMLVLLGTLGSLLVWQPLIGLSIFVGGGLLFAGITDSCLMGMLLMRLPYNRTERFDARAVIDRIQRVPA
jgi:rhodanese-related sulfurtransferase